MNRHFLWILAAAAALVLSPLTGLAAEGAAEPWQLGFQKAASTSAERMQDFHFLLLVIITAITAFVSALLLYVMVRYNRRVNPKPSANSHNTVLEVVWTVIPVVILIIIAVPSFQLLYYTDRTAEPEMTLKVTGFQWYWGYEYPDYGEFSFMSYMVQDEDIDKSKGQKRLLSTTEPVVLPIDTNIQILVTSQDVLHAWAVPALGLKTDAVPGRMNETWVRIKKPGTYYGQCSELCGKDHAYMPIEIKAVTKDEFRRWILWAKREFSSIESYDRPVRLAQTEVR